MVLINKMKMVKTNKKNLLKIVNINMLIVLSSLSNKEYQNF